MKKIKDLDYYYATKEGEIISFCSSSFKVLKGSKNYRGYRAYTINKKTIEGHRLIAETFLPNLKNLPQVNHKNGIKHDNRVENLEWVTVSQNAQHAWDTGLQPIRLPHNAATTQHIADTIRKEYLETNTSQRKLAKKYNIGKTSVARILKADSYNLEKKQKPIIMSKTLRKITFEEAEEIRRLYLTKEYSFYKLGKIYGINDKTVKKIIDRKTYKTPKIL